MCLESNILKTWGHSPRSCPETNPAARGPLCTTSNLIQWTKADLTRKRDVGKAGRDVSREEEGTGVKSATVALSAGAGSLG